MSSSIAVHGVVDQSSREHSIRQDQWHRYDQRSLCRRRSDTNQMAGASTGQQEPGKLRV